MHNFSRLLLLSFIVLLFSCEEFLNTLEENQNSCENGITVTDLQQQSENAETCRDGNLCSLSGAIATVNFCSDEKVVITLEQGATYLLDSTNAHSIPFFNTPDSIGNTAFPTITSDITIEGNGATLERTANASDLFRIFHIAKEGSLTLKNLTLKGGDADVGNMNPNDIKNRGGAIYNEGRLMLENCIVQNNISGTHGGGIYSGYFSKIFVYESIFKSNKTFDGGIGKRGGGAIFTTSDTVYLEKSVFEFNEAVGGGAITFNGPASDVNGIYINPSLAIIKQCLFEGNTASTGGAIGTTLGELGLNGLTSNILRSLIIENTTFSNNSSVGQGGTFYCINSHTYLTNCTIVNNEAGYPLFDGLSSGGGFHFEFAGAVFENCVLDNGLGEDIGGNQYTNTSFTGTNFLGNSSYFTNEPGVLKGNPQLSTLTGTGYQRGYEPLAGSPLIDAGSSAGCLTEDQRGNPRPVGAGCDLGAIEVQ